MVFVAGHTKQMFDFLELTMLKYFVLLFFSTCLICAGEDRHSMSKSVVGIKVKRDAVFEKVNEEIPSRLKRSASEQKSYIFLDNRSGKTAKLYWRDVRKKDPPRYYKSISATQSIAIDTYNVHEWSAKDILGRALLINDKQNVRQEHNQENDRSIFLIKSPGQRSTDIGDLYIELMVVLDKAAVDRHRNDEEVKRYVVTLLRLATSVLQHKDITQHGIKIHLVLSKLVLLRREMDEVKLDPGKRENNLRKVCTYMNKIGNSGTQRYDNKLFITKNDFGMGGYANSKGMCSQYVGCTIVQDHGFQASFLVAHELAHTFGADDQDFGQFSGFVMSRIVDARFDAYNWSKYSQVLILANIRKYDCMKNKAVPLKNLPSVSEYPGVHYSFNRQCQLEYDDEYSAWTGIGDSCSKLKCQMPAPYSHLAKTTNSPALDGTECGTNKWCLSGTCTLKTGKLYTEAKTEVVRINGGWGDWRQWSRCSRTCSTGVQTRERRCDKPTPTNGGSHCVGKSVQVRICNTKKVCPKHVSEKDSVCEVAGRKTDVRRRWKFYDDSIANLDCTFETGTCGWSNDKKSGLKPWTLNKGKTPSSNTGPSSDNTLKTSQGQYIYFESSTPTTTKAVLVSPEIKAGEGCLQFSYHMFGDNRMGLLRVLKRSGGVSTLLWKISGNRGNRWYRRTMNIQNSDPYQLLFMAKKKDSGYRSDIALDDISFTPGSCSSSQTVTKRAAPSEDPCKIKCVTSDSKTPKRIISSVSAYDGTACSTKTTTGVCYQGKCKNVGCFNILTDDNKDNCVISKGKQTEDPVQKISTNTKKTISTTAAATPNSRLDCDFERSYCQWRNLPRKSTQNPRGNELFWLRHNEAGKGYYLRIRQLQSGSMKVGSITSPEVNMHTVCFRFSYKFTRKGGYARFAVKYVKSKDVPRAMKYLSSAENWTEVNVSIQISQPYKIVFEALLAGTYTGSIGIDNIRFNAGRCP